MKKLIVCIWILAFVDWLLTYIAIANEWATELNVLIAWTFEYDIIFSMFLRLLLMGIALIPFYYWVRFRPNGQRIVKLMVSAEIIIVCLHIRWIVPVIKYFT